MKHIKGNLKVGKRDNHTVHSRSNVTVATCVGRTVPGGIFIGLKSIDIASFTGVVITFCKGLMYVKKRNERHTEKKNRKENKKEVKN